MDVNILHQKPNMVLEVRAAWRASPIATSRGALSQYTSAGDTELVIRYLRSLISAYSEPVESILSNALIMDL